MSKKIFNLLRSEIIDTGQPSKILMELVDWLEASFSALTETVLFCAMPTIRKNGADLSPEEMNNYKIMISDETLARIKSGSKNSQ